MCAGVKFARLLLDRRLFEGRGFPGVLCSCEEDLRAREETSVLVEEDVRARPAVDMRSASWRVGSCPADPTFYPRILGVEWAILREIGRELGSSFVTGLHRRALLLSFPFHTHVSGSALDRIRAVRPWIRLRESPYIPVPAAGSDAMRDPVV